MEKKRAYVKPSLESEAFVPNTYVAACGDHGANYNFTCDAGGGSWGDVYLSNGTNLTKDGWLGTNYFHACMKTHSAPTDDVYEKGYLILNGGNDETGYYVGWGWNKHWEDYEKIPVIIWRGDGSVHTTTNLDIDHWETDKS